jgi:ABC-type glutathione transport system ATPase component
MSLLLSVRDLSLKIKDLQLLFSVSMDVFENETVAIFGRSGSGKTMLSRIIADLLRINQSEIRGEVLASLPEKEDPIDLLTSSSKEKQEYRRTFVSYIFQNPSGAFNPSQRCGKQLDEAVRLAFKGMSKTHRKFVIEEMLSKLDFVDVNRIQQSYPHELSGGQLQRVMIAMALLKNPSLLILDEPMSSLDSQTSEIIINLLKKLQLEMSFSMILISHNVELIKRIANRIYNMDDGKLTPLSIETIQKKNLANQIQSVSIDEVIVSFESVSHFYTKSKSIFSKKHRLQTLDQVSLQMFINERLGLMGVSGSGKSTIAKLLIGFEQPATGEVRFKNRLIYDWLSQDNKSFRKSIQLIFQHPLSSLNPRQTVRDCLNEVLVIHAPSGNRQEQIAQLLQSVFLSPEYLNRFPGQLSGGEQQRLAIARALAVQPEVLICDECVSSLDTDTKYEILDLLIQLQEKNQLSILFISHDKPVIDYFCHRHLTIQEGKVSSHSESP